MPSRADPTEHHDDDLGIYGLPGDVSPWDVRFDPGDVAFLEPLGEGRFVLRVWAEPALSEARVVLRSGELVTSHAMEPIAGGRFTHWVAEIGLVRDADFSFAFMSPSGHPVYRVNSGISAAVERLDRFALDTDRSPVAVPDWAQGAVIYQIFPDRFHNGDPGNDPPETQPWGSEPADFAFQGGDLAGVAERLGYLADLGVDCLYINPVFTSPSNHRYDTVDYYRVDPALGGNTALDRLVTQAHEHGVRVILDASFNHVHPDFFAFRDLLEKGRDSAYRDWFVVADWPLRVLHRPERTPAGKLDWLERSAAQAGVPIEEVSGSGRWAETTYESWYHVPTMPRVDLAYPEAREYMLEVARHWVAEHGIDGWRMDVTRYVDPDFWDDLRRVVKSANPDAYLLAEVMGDAAPWLQGDRFDATMNYTFRSLAVAFFARDEIDGAGLVDGAARTVHSHAWPVSLANHNLIGSHDTPRFLTEAGGDLVRLRLATVFQLTFPGAPGLYYGDEVGMTGGPDPLSRGGFPWDSIDHDHPVRETVRELTALRRHHPALRTGIWRPLGSQHDAVAYWRRDESGSLLVVINRGPDDATFETGHTTQLLWGNGLAEGSTVTVPARDAAIFH